MNKVIVIDEFVATPDFELEKALDEFFSGKEVSNVMAWPKGVKKGPDYRPLRQKRVAVKAAPGKSSIARQAASAMGIEVVTSNTRDLMKYVHLVDAVTEAGFRVDSMTQEQDGTVTIRTRR